MTEQSIFGEDFVKPEEKQYNTLNLGPTHPATHGVFQNILQMDGEIIMSAEPTIGYIHRAFEKLAERRPFYQVTPITDRLNYCSAPINNIGWHMTVEKLLQVETPKRVDYMRVIIMELARISDHLVCNAVLGVDAGALTGFTYMFQERERIYDMFEELAGARLTTNIGRVGGFERDLTPGFHTKLKDFLAGFPKRFEEFDRLITRNRIFMDRVVNVGPISAEKALS
jgi:NADH-quinone oxidoreductase subunit D